jgi:type IV fimbrial biogenesis protein FimT
MFTRSEKGFTLIELMVTISVVAILASVAVPSFSNFIVDSRVRADMQNLVRSSATARAEAVSRAEDVLITATAEDWSQGWRVWVDRNSDGKVDKGETVKLVPPLSEGASLVVKRSGTVLTEFSFNRQGFLSDPESIAMAYELEKEGCAHSRDINISASGQLSLAEGGCK